VGWIAVANTLPDLMNVCFSAFESLPVLYLGFLKSMQEKRRLNMHDAHSSKRKERSFVAQKYLEFNFFVELHSILASELGNTKKDASSNATVHSSSCIVLLLSTTTITTTITGSCLIYFFSSFLYL